MTEWQRLSFSSTYEMPRRIVSQLNRITEDLKAFASAGQAAADERYELAYRDHLLQRFYRVEAGTVKMTTNLYVDLRELFVMPHVTVRPKKNLSKEQEELNADAFMNLSEARAIFGDVDRKGDKTSAAKSKAFAAIEQVRQSSRNVVVGLPGGGKSTLFEWLQLSFASVDEELVAGGEQVIPLLLRVRQLDPKKLPYGADLIEKATASHDRAKLMPQGWIDRQMKAGRVLVMLDGLDETEPGIRDKHILPWLADLCKRYPKCLYLVSSRPVGYPPGTLRRLKFAECDLEDFREPQITEYTRHWCTAIRLAQNDPEDEARREGAKEGDAIVSGFKGHPYIRNLARNPLMLSAICLVNYFEGGELPKDRAMLYRLCVEGLLHHWDNRRGIRSEYSLDEKLRVCREVAIAMQKDDRAEYESEKVLKVFSQVLKNKDRAKKLLEHIRYRTGLLIERRADVFAFAHLTFQEYLAACSVYEGNRLKLDVNYLAREHADGRWNEVIALYCGLASSKSARQMIELLISQPATAGLAEVLAEAFLSSMSELSEDKRLREKVIRQIAICYGLYSANQLNRFAIGDVVNPANFCVGRANTSLFLSGAYFWLKNRPAKIDHTQLARRLEEWRSLNSKQLCELIYLTHAFGPDRVLSNVAKDPEMYAAAGPKFGSQELYRSQAEVALMAIDTRVKDYQTGVGRDKALLEIMRVITRQKQLGTHWFFNAKRLLFKDGVLKRPSQIATWPEYILLARKFAAQLGKKEENAVVLETWADELENEMHRLKNDTHQPPKPRKLATPAKRSTKKFTKRSRKR